MVNSARRNACAPSWILWNADAAFGYRFSSTPIDRTWYAYTTAASSDRRPPASAAATVMDVVSSIGVAAAISATHGDAGAANCKLTRAPAGHRVPPRTAPSTTATARAPRCARNRFLRVQPPDLPSETGPAHCST